MILLCEICEAQIGTFDKLELPLTAGQFKPLGEGHMPPFLDDSLDWVWMKCRVCGHRPFIERDRVLTDEGLRVICPVCGKLCKEKGLKPHMRAHKEG